MRISGKHVQPPLKYACSGSFLNQSTKHSQRDFEEDWLKTLTDDTLRIMIIHISSQLLWSFQQKPEKEKKSHFILSCLFTRKETLKNLDNIHTCRLDFYADNLCRVKAKYTASVWRMYAGTQAMGSQTELDSVGQMSQYPARGPNNIYCSKCISLCCCWTKQSLKS